MMKKKTQKNSSSHRKPISYSTEFRLDINLNNFVRKLCPAMKNVNKGRGGERRGGELKCYIHTYIHSDRHTEPPTKRVLEEHSLLKIGCRRWHYYHQYNNFIIDPVHLKTPDNKTPNLIFHFINFFMFHD